MCFYEKLKNSSFLLTAVLLCFFFGGCSMLQQVTNEAELQTQAIEERLKEWELGEMQIACDGCNFYSQEAIKYQNATVNEGQIGGSRSQSGMRVYYFDNVKIDEAFLLLLDSNLFAQGINRGLRLELMEAIKEKKNDFAQKGTIEKGSANIFASLSYAKRLQNNPSLPRAMLDSVEIIQGVDDSSRDANSLEGYIVKDKVIILHFYTESQSWKRR